MKVGGLVAVTLTIAMTTMVLHSPTTTALFADRTPGALVEISFNTTDSGSTSPGHGTYTAAPFSVSLNPSTAGFHVAAPRSTPLSEPGGVFVNGSCTPPCAPPGVSSGVSFEQLLPLFANSSGFSLELWFRPSATDGVFASPLQAARDSGIVERDCGPNALSFRAWQFLQTGENITFTVADERVTPPNIPRDCVSCSSSTPASQLVQGELYHVVATYPQSGTGHISLYINGSSVNCASQPLAQARGGEFATAWAASAGELDVVIGARRDGDHPWLGSVYLYAVYGFELSQAEVNANTRAGPYNIAPIPTTSRVDVVEDSLVLANLTAYDPVDSAARFTTTVTTLPSHGSLFTVVPGSLAQGGPITAVPFVLPGGSTLVYYVPEPDFQGDDTLFYTVGDGEAVSFPSPVTLAVANVDDPPVINVPPSSVTGSPAGFRTPLGALVFVDDVDAGVVELSLSSSHGLFRFEPALAFPDNATRAGEVAAALSRLEFAVGDDVSGYSGVMVAGQLADVQTGLLAAGYYRFRAAGLGPDSVVVRAAHVGVASSASFGLVSPAPSWTLTSVATTPVVAGTVSGPVTFQLSLPVPCGSSLEVVLGVDPSPPSVGFVGYPSLFPSNSLSVGAGDDSGTFTVTGLNVGVTHAIVVSASGTGAAFYELVSAPSVFVANVTRGSEAVVSMAPVLKTYPESVIPVTVSLTNGPLLGSSLLLTPILLDGPGVVGFQDVPAVFGPGESTGSFTMVGTGPFYGNVTLGFVQAGTGSGVYAIQDVFVAVNFTRVVPVVDSVVSFGPHPPYVRVGNAAPSSSPVVLSAPVQVNGEAVLDVRVDSVDFVSASTQGSVRISESPSPVVVSGDGVSGFGVTLFGVSPGFVYGSLVLGGNSGAQFDTSSVEGVFLTRVLPENAFGVCDNSPLFLGENCTMLYFLASERGSETVATVADFAPDFALTRDSDVVTFPANSPEGPLVVQTRDYAYEGVSVSISVPSSGGGEPLVIASEPVVVVRPDALIRVAAPRWIRAGGEVKPFVLALPYDPRTRAEALVMDARQSRTDDSTAPYSVVGGDGLALSAGVGNVTFRVESGSSAVTGTIYLGLFVDEAVSSARLQYEDPVSLLDPIEVLEEESVTYVSGLDRDLVVGTERDSVVALTIPVAAGEVLELELVSSGSGEVAFLSSSTSVSTRGIQVVTLQGGEEFGVLRVQGTRVGWVSVTARIGSGSSGGASSAYDVSRVEYVFRVVPPCPFGEEANCAFTCSPIGSDLDAACGASTSPSSDSLLVILLAALASCCLFLLCLALCLFLMRKRRSKEDKELDKAAQELRSNAVNKVKVEKHTVVVLESVTASSDEGYEYMYDEYGYGVSLEDVGSEYSYDRYLDGKVRY